MAKDMKQEDIQTKAVLNGVDLIHKSMQLAFRTNLIAGGGAAGIATILVLMAERIITALADTLASSKDEAMEEYFNMIREHMSTLDKDKN